MTMPVNAPTTVVVGGAQKSCTSSLAAALGNHPNVAMKKLECYALEGTLWRLKARKLRRERDRAIASGMVFGFKRPETFHRSELTERVYREFPEAAFIVVLRDPLERLVSAMFHYFRHGRLKGPLDVVPRLEALLTNPPWMLSYTERQLLEYSMYAQRYAHVRGRFGRRTILLFQEELLADPQLALDELQRSLGLGATRQLELGRENLGSYRTEARPLARVAGALTYRRDRGTGGMSPRGPLPWLIARPFSMADGLLERRRGPADRPLLSDALVERASELFSPDVHSLEELIGRSVPSAWRIGGRGQGGIKDARNRVT